MSKALANFLAKDFLEKFPQKALLILEEMEEGDLFELLESLPAVLIGRFFTRLPSEGLSGFLLRTKRLEEILEEIDFGDLARVLGRSESSLRKALLERLPDFAKREVVEILNYPPDTAGSLMETEIHLFHPDDEVGLVVSKIRKKRGKNISSVFLVDESGILKGRVYLQDLMVADDNSLLGSVAKSTEWVSEMTPKEDVVEVVKKSQAPSLPVLNAEGLVLGVIRYEALFSMAQIDGLDDLQAMVGVSKDEKALSTPFFSMRKRLPWLSINLVTTFVAAFVVGLFENTIAQITALAVLLPVVAGQSGNTGAQAQAVTMRGLALREIRLRHKWKVLFKEGFVGLYNGVIIGVLCAVSVFFWSGSAPLGLVIGTSMVLAMMAASLSGAAIPMILTALNQDPATSSSIILTTVTDIVGFLSFLGLATIFSSYLI